MALFLSTVTNRIDKKGRVSVPSVFRNNLTSHFSGLVLFRSLKSPILEGCDYDRLLRLSEERDLAQNNNNISVAMDYMAMMFAEAQLITFDSEGRISIPPTLLDHANIKDQLTFVGRGATFEIWEPGAFVLHHDALRAQLKGGE